MIPGDERAALCDLDPLVHVHAGILAADDVFRRWKIEPQPKADERHGRQGRHTQSAYRSVPEQPPAVPAGDDDAENDIDEEQSFEPIQLECCQTQCDR